jgi:hypothetical protein
MALLSRSFIRKRLISLATTLSVSATSFALAQDPTTAHHIRATAADFNEQQFLFDNDLAMSNWVSVPSPSSVTMWPETVESGVTHERTAVPSMCTVQAPHCPRPQPKRGPCKPSSFLRM